MNPANVERLLSLLRAPSVSRPEAIHKYECPYWREGKKHGECNCGARRVDTAIRQALIDCGVSVHESPNEISDRLAYARAGAGSRSSVWIGSSNMSNDRNSPSKQESLGRLSYLLQNWQDESTAPFFYHLGHQDAGLLIAEIVQLRMLLQEWLKGCPNPPPWHWAHDVYTRTVRAIDGTRPRRCRSRDCARYRNLNGGCDVCGAPCL